MQLSDLFSLIGLGGVAIGLFLNVWAVHRGNAQKRSEFLMELYNSFLSDDVSDIFFKLEYEKIKTIQADSKDEKNLNKLLTIFDNIGHLFETSKNFNKNDLEYFATEIISIYTNPIVKKYLEKLNDDYADLFEKLQLNKNKTKTLMPFEDFKKLAEYLLKQYK